MEVKANENVVEFVKKLLDLDEDSKLKENVEESAFDFFGESYRLKLTEQILSRLKIVDTICLISVLLSYATSFFALEYNVEFMDFPESVKLDYKTKKPLDGEKEKFKIDCCADQNCPAWLKFSPELKQVEYLRYLGSFLTFIIVICIILHYIIKYKYDKFRFVIPKNMTVFNSRYSFWMLFEIFLNLIHTPPLKEMSEYIEIRQRTIAEGTVKVYYDVILTILLLLFRSYHIMKYYAFHSKWNNIHNEKICNKANVKFNFYFCIKCEFKDSPFFLVVILLIQSIFVLGYSLRCSEMFFMKYTEENEYDMDWRQTWNGFWCIIITMMTVGFGDFYPKSTMGRIIAVFATFWGTFLVSMMVAALTIVVEFNSQEATAYNNINNAASERQYGLNAVILIQNSFRYILQVRKLNEDVMLINEPNFRRQKSVLFDNMKKAFINFRNIRAIKEKQSYYSELEVIMKKLNANISNEMAKIKEQINVMPEIKYSLKDYQEGQDKLKVKIIELYKELEEMNIFKNLFVKEIKN